MTVLFVLLNIAVIAWTAFKEFGGSSDSTRFSDVRINYLFLLPAALCCIGAIVAETVKYAFLMKKGRRKSRLARCAACCSARTLLRQRNAVRHRWAAVSDILYV